MENTKTVRLVDLLVRASDGIVAMPTEVGKTTTLISITFSNGGDAPASLVSDGWLMPFEQEPTDRIMMLPGCGFVWHFWPTDDPVQMTPDNCPSLRIETDSQDGTILAHAFLMIG